MRELKKSETLPKATAKRLPLYLRYLKMLDDSGIVRIKSKEFSEITQVPPATIRRDFSHLGELGRSGYGYDVPFLIEVFNSILNTREEKRIALVGYGNLGKALRHNNFRRNDNLNIVCVFDNDPELIGREIDGLTIYPIERFAEVSKEMQVSVAITTVPSKYSQSAIDEIVKSEVTAILNFAPDRVVVPEHINIQYIDLTTELQTLIYFDENYSTVFS
ncbi:MULTISPECIES: redox-sensing transcriptional repressor Rex [Enterococcus]|uniref:Redox-sensing transcriptional repressor Rex n=2 Tax=root TaxID=1 RepID=A0A179EUC9_ENTTH|nr:MULTISPECIES: redox-sensing transcriptional repressor Rex [Enterococcus]ASZ08117.1 redox-sensing transcriptional repressor Rex [Enterococcus thailandicus]MDA3964266.1 redox-sensing transcriptional repressor Rex [Enterococcus thailandicus]MDK4353069.1 redox-sensing transcriptional repressor Rex [Enterococcus thailandicus]MDT2734113.1 redox-sensing transcriptional repressor Rex [Enterococcus thailandicus]MDT2752202.1 redox-sensing transcriptional repressor Rex [Enterococcus thailandicus]